MGGLELDLGRLVEKALQNQMNAKLSFIEARAAKTKQTTRLSVARLRFHLDGPTDPKLIEQALAQALRGYLLGYAGFDVYSRGSAVAPIDGGLFDVNALLNVK